MKVSPHTHPESYLTGSTLQGLVDRAKELGRTHFAYTDHGSLSSALKVHGLVKKAGLKSILGFEFYFKDPSCPFVAGTPADRARYFTATIYCEDQSAYQKLVEVVSRTDFPTVKINDTDQNLWNWSHLEELSKFKTNIVLAGVHCMVGKPMLAGAPVVGQGVLLRLRELFPERLFMAVLAEPWMKKYSEVVEIKYRDGSRDALLSTDTVTTDRARRIKAKDLIERAGHSDILSKYTNMAFYEVNKSIEGLKLHKGFLPYPGGDVTLRVNKFFKALGAKHHIPLLVTDYAYYATAEDRVVQDMKLEGANKMHASLHMKNDNEVWDYLTKTMLIDNIDAGDIVVANETWASRFNDFKLEYDWRLAETEGVPVMLAMEIVKKVGRMDRSKLFHVERLREELAVIAKNGKKDLTGYFIPIYDMVNYYLENGELTGPGRGSAAGSFLAYCMGITHVDPFKYDLSFSRFYSQDRINDNKLADIDTDLEGRELLVGDDGKSGYLYKRWGNKAAQIGTRQTLRLKSTIKDTNRYINGKVEEEVEALTKALPDAPQGVSDDNFLFGYEDDDGNHVPGLLENSEPLQEYAMKRPKEWAIVQKALGITRAFSSHASAFVIADVPISSLVPTRNGNITQYEAKEAEAAGLIKYDMLVVSQLKDVRVCIDLINKKTGSTRTAPTDIVGWWHPESDSGNCSDCDDMKKAMEASDGFCVEVSRQDIKPEMVCGLCKRSFTEARRLDTGWFSHQGKRTYVWDLPHDLAAFKSVWNGSTETIFQVSTKTATPFVKSMHPQSIDDYAIILALGRPGPMDYIDEKTGRNMAEEYIHRRKGGAYSDIKILNELIPETLSVLVYQEQITKIAKAVAGFSGSEAEQLRENIGKKKKEALMATKPRFIAGCVASGKVTTKEAEELWARIETAGRYSFNKSHAVSYAFITYACIFLKHNYPLEWWASVLSNAKEKEITTILWPYVKDLVLPPDINLSSDEMVVDYANQKIRSKIGIIRGLGDATIDPIVAGRPYADIHDFIKKGVAGAALTRKLIHVGVLDSLFPPKLAFLEKLKLFEDALEIQAFMEKKEKADKEGKVMRLLQPKEGKLPPAYVGLTPLKEAVMKKSVLPSLPVDFFALGKRYSRVLHPHSAIPHLVNKKKQKTMLLTGEHMRRFDELDGSGLKDDVYFAVTAYVVETKVIGYPKANPTKQMLKLVLDADNYVSEKVLWPDYETGKLIYPPELKKGSIVSVFMKKRMGKRDVQVTEIVVET